MFPLAMKYAACIFDGPVGDVEVQISHCRPLRSELEAEAPDILVRFHPGRLPNVDKGFHDLLESVELDARRIQNERKFISPSIIKYIQCTSQKIVNSHTFLSGSSIDYGTADEECLPRILPYNEPGISKSAKKRAQYFFLAVRRKDNYYTIDKSIDWTVSYQFHSINIYDSFGLFGDLDLIPAEPVDNESGK